MEPCPNLNLPNRGPWDFGSPNGVRQFSCHLNSLYPLILSNCILQKHFVTFSPPNGLFRQIICHIHILGYSPSESYPVKITPSTWARHYWRVKNGPSIVPTRNAQNASFKSPPSHYCIKMPLLYTPPDCLLQIPSIKMPLPNSLCKMPLQKEVHQIASVKSPPSDWTGKYSLFPKVVSEVLK